MHTLAALNGLQPGDTLRTGQRLVLKRTTAKAVPSGTGAMRRVQYTVRRGDTLSRIARLFQVTIDEIMSWNGIADEVALRPGQRLTINVRSKIKG